jgi:LysR family transcriptional regulator, glycine cleavage system transcriptional activator
VKLLELNLGQQLFQRQPHGLQLTKTGEAYLPKVEDAFERLAVGTREVFGRRSSESLTLRCAVSFAVNWLAPRLPDFLSRHPDKPVRLLSSVWSDSPDPETFDLDIQYGTGSWTGFTSHRLTQENIMPLCCPETAQRLKMPDDLARERLLHVMGYQEGWGIWINAAGTRALETQDSLQVDTSLVAFALAAAGAGVALGRSSLVGEALAQGLLIKPFALEVPVKEGFFLLEPQSEHFHPDAGAFTSWLCDIASRGHR